MLNAYADMTFWVLFGAHAADDPALRAWISANMNMERK